jgi:hypothetical protein
MNSVQEAAHSPIVMPMDHRTRILWLSIRDAIMIGIKIDCLLHEALIVALRGVETYLGMPLSIPPKERRL